MKNMGAVEAMKKIWKNSMKLVVLLTVLVLLPVLSFLPAVAEENRDFIVSGGTEGTHWTYTNGVLTFLKGGPYTIGMAPEKSQTDHQISINTSSIESIITLTLNNLNIDKNTGPCILFSGNKLIEAEFVLEGYNKIKNSDASSSSRCIGYANYANQSDIKISGSGSLELNSVNTSDQWSAETLTLESGSLKMSNVAINTNKSIYISGGSLDVTCSKGSCLRAWGEFYMTGGELNVTATGTGENHYCLEVLSSSVEMRGVGLEIKGNAKVSLITTGSAESAIYLYSYSSTNPEKGIHIDTDQTVTLENKGSAKAGIYLVGASSRDITFDNGSLLIKNFQIGIWRNIQSSGYTIFNGGRIEIICTEAKVIICENNVINDWGDDYEHINYTGTSPEDRHVTADDDVFNNGDSQYKYLLITPKNSILYNYNNGYLPSGVRNPDVYSSLDLPLTLKNPIRYNSEFLGWTGSNGNTPEKNVTIIAGETGPKNYIANWKSVAFGVSISAKDGMSMESGHAAQVLQENDTMTDVIYTADDGYYFPEGYTADVPPGSGITVTRINAGQIIVSGSEPLTADVHIFLPNAEKKEKKDTPAAVFMASGTDSGKLTNVEPGMQYSLDGGTNWIDIGDTSIINLSDVKSANGIQVINRGDEITLDSDVQTIKVTKAKTPTSVAAEDCSTSTNDDGKLIGVTTAMEYQKSGDPAWKECTDSEIIVPDGTYLVRVKAEGTILASDYVTVTVNPWTAPDQVPAPTFSHPSGTYEGAQLVTISCSEEGAEIHYTMDGTGPTTASPVYSEPITVNSDTVIRAFAVKEGMIDSSVVETNYKIYIGKQIRTDIGFSSTYDGEPHGAVIRVTDPAEGAVIKYGISEGVYDLEESPKITDVGSMIVYYQVTAEEYETLTGSVTLTVIKPEGSDDPSQCYPPCSP